MLLLLVLFITTNAVFGTISEALNHWKEFADRDIQEALNVKNNENVAKNVVIFIGDGMGLTTVTASRIYGPKEEGFLSFEKFPHTGILKTYSANKYVPDSCSTATAMFSGVKTNHKTAGVDSTVKMDDCDASLNEKSRLKSIFDWGQAVEKSTGFVTTTRVTHATPSALYAHIPNRNWECEGKIPGKDRGKCKDIARQLVEDFPGKNIQVVMGGGRQCLQSNVSKNDEFDPVDSWACYRMDGKDLIKEWTKDKAERSLRHSVVYNNEQLSNVDTANTDFLLGIFSNSHMKMEHARDKGPKGSPSLSEMTLKAYEILRKNDRGFILMVEGGLIDFAHHRGKAKKALDETLEFSKSVKDLTNVLEINKELDDTLIVVTSDHSHSLVLAGYADRTKSILDVAQDSKIDKIPYTSLLYGTGGPDNYQYFVNDEHKVQRKNPLKDGDVTDFEYVPQSGIVTDEVTHDGTDVLVYAKGPMAHLFHNVHEQTYIAYVMAYSAKIGPFKDNNYNSAGNSAYFRMQFSLALPVLFICLYVFNL